MNQTLLIIIFSWLFLVSIVGIWILIYFKKLSKGVDKGNLIKILDSLISKEDENERSIKEIEKVIKDIKEDNIYHIQKVAIVRFNPFRELGGDHSFSLALLNAKYSGFVITGLHTRERTRVYVKKIDKGKSTTELSQEEKEVIKKAERGEGKLSS
ncbi:hypothetical protein A2W13_03560 [Candidatus Woesebacteria bacterium RBG_16_36_11]|uniref:DUF4446 domain-containing protein n=1 Tax=Candidatus Woesebacteria bacterium RBG_16_36_11 TaxID=1802481 RepID=A0A1F7XA25_9BACT|nr:MAG: hypothetical protein A2W13_03560 [Candidatus Woesebacteria bacterium RBG_16_36_11]HJX45986.1 DUF4446 family protein [Patescibacteria group bacterium]